MTSPQSTQPFSDVSQPGADLQQLVSALPNESAFASSPIDLALVRVFAKCYLFKHAVTVKTYPDSVRAVRLNHDILAISQSIDSTGCDIQVPTFDEDVAPVDLRLYFDPSQDTILAENMSRKGAFELAKPAGGASHQVLPRALFHLEPGTWTVLSPSPSGLPTKLLDLYIRPRRFWVAPETPDVKSTAGSKRPQASPEEASADPPSSKKQKAPAGSRHVQASTVITTHPLLEANDGETVSLTGQNFDDRYSVTRNRLLASTRFASLYTANHSSRPDQVVIAKTIKLGYGARSAIRQWHREVTTHESIGYHPNIVQLFSSDARALTIYMEYIDTPDLSRSIDESRMCSCPNAARTILSDLAKALQFIHASGFVHNDIKPANILYHKHRGAILVDFGLGGKAAETHSGGTPWYLPPEYLEFEMRGPAGDVFALGVTMLWVLRKYSLSDMGQPWQIGDLHTGAFDTQARAEGQMRRWLGHVEMLRSQLDTSKQSIENIVSRMLQKQGRCTAKEVVQRLKSVE